jgi:hypothetical protein
MNSTEQAGPCGSPLTEGLGPLPEAALTVVHNAHTMERQVSTHGVAYYGSNWYAERECYTADQMRAYALAEVRRAVGAILSRCQGKTHDGCAYLGHCGMVCDKCGQVA